MSFSIARPKYSSYAKRFGYVLKALIKQPSQVAMVCPSSPFLTDAIADRDCVRDANLVVELGPGAGGTTLALLEQMKPESRLIAIEKTPTLAEAVKQIGDPRLTCELGDACDLVDLLRQRNLHDADVIVSGIPFSSIRPFDAKKIVESIYSVLRPGGTFIAYQFRDDVKDYARPLFGPAETETVQLNLPPLAVHTWNKVSCRCS